MNRKYKRQVLLLLVGISIICLSAGTAFGDLMWGSIQNTPLATNINYVTTFAGSPPPVPPGSMDDIGSAARFNSPAGVTSDGVSLFVTDQGNHTIRQIVISTGTVTTLAGTAGVIGSLDDYGPLASFNGPAGITTDGTNLYVADMFNHTIRKIEISTGTVTTIAGIAGVAGFADGTGASALFNAPRGITTDGANLFVADSNNHTIRKIEISTGVVTTIAGSAGASGAADDIVGANARFNNPTFVNTDGINLYVTDTGNNTIRKIDISTGEVMTLAGSPPPVAAGSADGTGAAALFNGPLGMTNDGTYLYVTDSSNNTIRKVVISTGVVTTLAGSPPPIPAGSSDGVGSAAGFDWPRGIANNGVDLFVVDTNNNTIRRIASPPTHVLTINKTGTGTGTVTSNKGGINCGVTCSSTPLTLGTVVTLTAAPDPGSTFVGWSGGGCTGLGQCVTTINDETTVTAVFNVPTNKSGVISTTTTWTLANSPYYVTGSVTVNSGVTLTIEAGVIVKFAQYAMLSVYGTVNANGTLGSEVYFTDYRDDTVGGDTNGDGSVTVPAAGWWHSIYIYNGGAADLKHCVIRYAGYSAGYAIYKTGTGILSLTDSVISNTMGYGMRIDSTSDAHVISGNAISGNSQSGIYLNNAGNALTISGNSITGNGNYGIYFNGNSAPSAANMTSNTISGNPWGQMGFTTIASGAASLYDGIISEPVLVEAGSISGNIAWSSARVYYLKGSVTVNSGVILTIGAGVKIKFAQYAMLSVYGTVNANGTLGSEVYFTDYRDDTVGGDTNGDGGLSTPAANWWHSIYIYSGGAADLKHCVIRYAGYSGGYAIYKTGTGILGLTDSVISNTAGYGIHLYGTSDAHVISGNAISGSSLSGIYLNNAGNALTISGNTITGNGNYGIYFNGNSAPSAANMTSNTISGNPWGQMGFTTTASGAASLYDGIISEPVLIEAGSISGNIAWSSARVYYLKGSVTVNSGVILTIGAGVKIKFAQYAMLAAYGTVNANGTLGSEVYFTDYRDDNVGGDTNGDGSVTAPAAGWWHSIYMYNGGAADLKHCVIRYAGYSGGYAIYKTGTGILSLADSVITNTTGYGIYLNSTSDPHVISGNTIQSNTSHGIYFNSAGSGVTLTGNTFTGNGGYGLYLSGATTSPVLADAQSFSGNTKGYMGYTFNASWSASGYDALFPGQTIFIEGGTSGGSFTLSSNRVYYVKLDIDVASGNTVTVNPGVIMKFAQYTFLRVYGTLNANGTSGNGIYFTDYRDDTVGGDTNGDGSVTAPAAGWWYSLYGYSGSNMSLSYVTVKYAGYSYGAVYKTGTGSISIANSVISNSGGHGINLDAVSSAYTISNNTILSNSSNGVYVNNATGTGSTISNNIIQSNTSHGIYLNSAGNGMTLTGNTFINNGGYGLYLSGATTSPVLADVQSFSGNTKGYMGYTFNASWSASGYDALFPGQTIFIEGGTSGGSFTLSSNRVYYVKLDIDVASGNTVTVNPGVIMKFAQYTFLRVYGTLNANGTSGSGIYFTDYRDDTVGGDTNGDGSVTAPAAGWWYSLYGYSGSNMSLNYVTVKYAGYGYGVVYKTGAGSISVANSVISNSGGHGITLDNTVGAAVTDNTIRNNNNSGIYITSTSASSPLIQGNFIYSNTSYGIYLTGATTTPNIYQNSIYSNPVGIYATSSANPVIGGSAGNGNNLYNNTTWSVQNATVTTPPTINATYNYWGSAAGPYHATTNTAGNVNSKVTDNVNYTSWAPAQVLPGPPSVESTSPVNWATGVLVNSPITVTFTEAITTASISNSNFTIVRQSDSAPVSGTVTYDAPSRTATFTPSVLLDYGTIYTVSLGAGITDLGGAALAGIPYSWSFTTVAGSCAAAPSGLVSWWKAEGNANDQFGINNGTLNGGMGYTTGKSGQSFSFDGVDDYVNFGTGPGNYGTGDYTLSFWIKTTAAPAFYMDIMNKRGGMVSGAWWQIRMNTTGHLYIEMPSSGAFSSNKALNDGTYHLVTQAKQGGANVLYIDGVQDSTIAAGASDMTNTAPFVVGYPGYPDGTQYFNGAIDEVQIYDRALTLAEIQAIYNAGNSSICSAPIIALDPTSYDFGFVPVGGLASWPVTISNTGTAVLSVNTTTISGSEYTVNVSGGVKPCGTTTPVIPAGSNCTVMVTVYPTSVGSKPGALTVTSNDTLNPSVSATFAANSSCPAITLAPASLPNGEVNASYSQSVAASGGMPSYSYSATAGALPPGFALSVDGLITGTSSSSGPYNFTITATDANGCTGSQAYSITIPCPTITFSTVTLSDGTAGVYYSDSVVATGGIGPYTYAFTLGSLPAGLTLSPSGDLSGIPAGLGNYNPTITATDANGCSASQAYAFVISCPTITLSPVSLSNGTQGTSYSDSVTASSGTAPYTYSLLSGLLPPGVTVSSAGILSGIPTTPGIYNFTLLAVDANGCGGSSSYTVTVSCPTITLSGLSDAVEGTSYSQTVSASGGVGPYTYGLATGSMPNGLSLSSSGVVSGIPTATGTFNFSINATDTNGCIGTQSYTMMVTCPTIGITPSTLGVGTMYSAYSQILSASGGIGPYTYALATGGLPSGMVLGGAGDISGTPTASGTFNFDVTVTDVNGCSSTQAFTLAVNAYVCPALTFDPLTLSQGMTASDYTQTVTAAGGTAPYTIDVTAGALPGGLGFAQTLQSSGDITGVPTAAGTFNFTVTAVDAYSCMGTQAYALQVVCPSITLTPLTLSNGTQGISYSQTIMSTGGAGPYTYSVTAGVLPPGLTLSGPGVLSGVPAVSGTYNFTVTAMDAYGCVGSQTYALVIDCPAIMMAPFVLPNGTTGVSYSDMVTASGGMGPYSYTVTSGPLPAGITLSPGGGLSGTPTLAGTSSFTITATDFNGCTGSQAYSIMVSCPAITFFAAMLSNGTTGVSYNDVVVATGGTSPYTYAVTSGILPAGLTLSSSGIVSGTPTTTGLYAFTVTATDANGCTGSQAYSITIGCPTISVTSTTLPDGMTGVGYSQSVTATGGTGPYTYAVTSGILPAGLTLSASGVVSGTPTTPGTYNFTVTAADANGCPSSPQAVSITICGLTLTPSSQIVPAAGGSFSIDVAATSPSCVWTAGSTDSWIAGVTGGATGNGTVTYSVLANSGPQRTGSISIGGQAFSVTQSSGCTYTVSPLTPNPADFGATGGAGTFSVVASNSLCPWSAISGDGTWLTTTATGTGTTTGSYTVIANTGAPRSTTIDVGGSTFTVSQGSGCAYILTPSTQIVAAAGGSFSIDVVATSPDCVWTANTTASWITIVSGGGAGNGMVTYTISANNGPEISGTISIGGQAFSVIQSSGCTYTVTPLSPNPANFGATGGAGTFSVSVSNELCPWTALSGDNTWLTTTNSGIGTATGNYTVVANTSGPRSSMIVVGGSSFGVSQGAGCAFTLTPSSQTAPAAGGSFSIDVVATSPDCVWTADTADSWIVGVTGGATGTSTVTYSVTANNGPERTGSISIGGQVFSVTQSSGCTYTVSSLSPNPANFGATGGTGTFSVSASNELCQWTAASGDNTWLTTSATGIGTATGSYTVMANTGTPRSSALTVGGSAFTVNQGAGCAFTFTPSSQIVPVGGGSFSIDVLATSPDCIWTAATTDSWITSLTGDATGSGTVTYTVGENTGPERTGSISIGGQVFNVTQVGVPVVTITAAGGPGGAIEPAGTSTAEIGSTHTFYITPDTGYVLIDVSVDGRSMGPMYSLTLMNLNDNHTISVTFGR